MVPLERLGGKHEEVLLIYNMISDNNVPLEEWLKGYYRRGATDVNSICRITKVKRGKESLLDLT